MSVLVDTPIWSLVFRRRPGTTSEIEQRLVRAFNRLVEEDRAILIGPIRQEVLSGIRDEHTFRRIVGVLRPFPDEPLSVADFEEAARASNRCRAAGISGTPVDMLICAVAIRDDDEIFTADVDFEHYRRVLPIRLFTVAS